MSYFSGVMSKKSEDKDIVKDLVGKWDKWYENLADVRAKANEYQKIYDGVPKPIPEGIHPDTPNYHVPMMETLVDTIVAKFFLSLFAHDPIIRYNPSDRSSVLATRITERMIHYYLNHRTPGALTQLLLWVTEAVLQGYSFLYVYWDKNATGKTVSVPIPKEVDEELPDEEVSSQTQEEVQPQMTEEELVRSEVKETVSYEGFQFSVLDMDDVAADFNETDIYKTPIIIREWLNPEIYQERVESMGYEEIEEEDLEKAIKDYHGPELDDDDDTAESRSKLELLHYFGKGYLTGEKDDKLQDMKITILRGASTEDNPDRMVKRISYGFKPICILRMKPIKGRLDGRGTGAQCSDLNDELDINFNSRLLNTSMSLHRMYKIGINAGIKDKSQLISRPNGFIEMENINEFQELNHTPLSPDAFASSRETIGYMQDVTAAQDIIQGKSQRQELATTASLIDSNAKQRLELHIFRMAKEALSQVGDILRFMLIEMHDPEDVLTAILSKDEREKFGADLVDSGGQSLIDPQGFLEVKVADLSGAMYADTEVSATDGDKRAVRQEMMQLFQILMQIAPGGIPTGKIDQEKQTMEMEKLNMPRWIRELFTLWGRVDCKDFVSTIEVPIPQVPPSAGSQQKAGPKEPPGASVPPPPSEMAAMLQSADRRMASGGE